MISSHFEFHRNTLIPIHFDVPEIIHLSFLYQLHKRIWGKNHLIILFSHITISKHFQSNELFIIKVTDVHCSDINRQHIMNASCYIKAQRGKFGLINIKFYVKNAKNVMNHFVILYRNSAGHFHPYLLDVTVDACRLSEITSGIFKFFMGLVPIEAKPCPLNVRKCRILVLVNLTKKNVFYQFYFNLTDFDFDGLAGKSLPRLPVIF